MGPYNFQGKLKAVDLFAGIGGFRLGLDKHGFQTVLSSEINPQSKDTYQANFKERPLGDIRLIDPKLIPDFNLLTAGFPCQTFSSAGVSKLKSQGRPSGFLDTTRGTLFFEVARILSERKPNAFILENVKNLVHHDSGRTLNIILDTLTALGYQVFYQVIDSAHWASQNIKQYRKS